MARSVSLVQQSFGSILLSWWKCARWMEDPLLRAVLLALALNFIDLPVLGSIIKYPESWQMTQGLRFLTATTIIFLVEFFVRSQGLDSTVALDVGKSVVRPFGGKSASFYPNVKIPENDQGWFSMQLNPATPLSVYANESDRTEASVLQAKSIRGTPLSCGYQEGSGGIDFIYSRCRLNISANSQVYRQSITDFDPDLSWVVIFNIVGFFAIEDRWGAFPKYRTEDVEVRIIRIRTWYSPLLALVWWFIVHSFRWLMSYNVFKWSRMHSDGQRVNSWLTPILWGYIDVNVGNSLTSERPMSNA